MLPQNASRLRSENRLLSMLSEPDLALLSERAERVTIPLKTIVAQAGEPTQYAYFR